MNVLGIDNVLLAVGDLEQARIFYGELLQLPEKFAFPEAGIVGYLIGKEEPGLLLRLDPDLPPAPPRATLRLWLEVSDARATGELLTACGAVLLEPARRIRTGWLVEVADTWGNVTGLTDYVLAPAQGRVATCGTD